MVATRTPTMLFRRLGRLMLLVHGPHTPTTEEWNTYVVQLGKIGEDFPDRCGLLVVTDGAGPTSAQREALKRYTPAHLRTGVVTGSALARGIVTMIGWITPHIRPFSPEAIDSALEYVGIAQEDRAAALRQAASMRAQLSGIGVIGDDAAANLLQETAIDPMFAIVTKLSDLRSELGARRRA